MTGHASIHISTTTIGTDPSPFTTDAAKEDTLTNQNHTVNPTIAEAPATIGETHPPPHPTTTAAHITHQLTDALGDTLAGTHCTGTTVTHPRHASFPTLNAILWTEADLVQDTHTILPTDHTQGRHQNCIHKQQLLINLTTRRRSPFKIHNWTPHQNQITTVIF